ncbi:ankyrin repeat domain-containing protein [Erythrobacter sp. F6033]|uniref:ankyrin repeat domain-containing protein n=1 Tax=Erythrobacter sp. F6033 TaxID=2926401 RepID=UPI001FF1BEB3|nr:ankyrin repeat domain-containing protein [Erythrobacter sp. F6033]MCK0129311.1 ankyrin repeat domain-containing protein [Erythrobacter sp. F6033]
MASILAITAFAPVAAQLYSPGYKFLEAVDERDGDTVTAMLNEPGVGKTLVNTRDITTGDTGLHIATNRRDTLWIKFLIQRGADPNIRNKKGVAPIQIATRLGMLEGVEQLIKGGAQVDVADSQGETPLISAVHQRNPQLVRRLLVQGANPDRNDNSGRSARDYMELMSQNTLLKLEFEKADKERGEKGTQEQYGPSF